MLGQWNYYAYTRTADTGSLAVYMDGIRGATQTTALTAPVFSGNATLKLGGGGGQQAFPGKIDEFRISNVARSADWIKATYGCMTDGDFASYEVVSENDWMNYAYKFTVTFPGYTESDTLTNFPVLVRVSDNSPEDFSYADCLQAEGGDLRFADAGGNILASEVDTWDTNGVSLIWVKVPSLTSSTTITAYYGSEAPGSVLSSGVWENGYVGVWHLGRTGNQTQVDSTSNRLAFLCHTKDLGNVDLSVSDGVVGGAVGFNKSSTGYGGLYLVDSESKLSGFTDCTIETWLYPTNNNMGRDIQVFANQKAYNAGSFYLGIATNTQSLVQESPRLMVCRQGTTQFVSSDPLKTPYSLNEWNYVAFTRTGNDGSIGGYLDGVLDLTKNLTAGALSTSTNEVVLGNSSVGIVTWSSSFYIYRPYAFPGYIDEMRISDVARSANWIKATHDTITSTHFTDCKRVRENNRRFLLLLQ